MRERWYEAEVNSNSKTQHKKWLNGVQNSSRIGSSVLLSRSQKRKNFKDADKKQLWLKKAWILRRQKNATDKQITLRNQRASSADNHLRENTRVRFQADPGKDLARITGSISGSNQAL